MAEPPRDGWDVHSRFNAARGKQMAQIMVGDAFHAGQLRSAVDGLLTFKHAHDARFGGFVWMGSAEVFHQFTQTFLNGIQRAFPLLAAKAP